MRNQLPADELAHIRDEIRVLKLRESELRACFLDGCSNGLHEGYKFDVEVRTQQRRVLNKSRLPAEILNDPQYYDTKSSPVVRVVARKEPHVATKFGETAVPVANDDFDVVETWNR